MRFLFLASCLLLVSFVPVVSAQTAHAPFLPVSSTSGDGGLPLVVDGKAASIYYDPADAAVVRVAAEALSADVQRVTGVAPAISTAPPTAEESVVLVGTVGRSALIDRLVEVGKLDVSKIRGQWEAYVAAVVQEPVPGVKRALVIAGSDRRGTAFGVFGLSEAMGVNPWYWWADVTPVARPALSVGGGVYTEASPGVRYRGVFLNDEDWGLQPWAAKTFDPATGDIGPKTYEKIFELLLRLHANFCWPAMHDCTRAFDTFPENKVVADRYAIVMGSSHHEPMLRNTSEYDAKARGPYNYWTNRENVRRFWEERVQEVATYENIYTVGMRGQTDDGINAPRGTTTAEKVDKLQNAILPDQRAMLAAHVAKDPASVPQMFVPYKEALLQYQAGLQVPDDVTLVWPDDNHGYIRELPTAAERQRAGGSGVYYHLSYWGVPKDFLWLCTTPPAVTWEEMSKAYDYDARRVWIVNIGDIKPGEIGMDFFLRLARHPEDFRGFSQTRYLREWATRAFGEAHADEVARLLNEYYRLNFAVRPEHLNPEHSGFEVTTEGDEAGKRLADFTVLVNAANDLAKSLPTNLQDAYYQLVLYPVRCSALMNQKILYAERSRLYAAQGRAVGTAMAREAARAAFEGIQRETERYNTGIAGGKWNRMMSAHPHPTRNDVFEMPADGNYSPPATAGLGVIVQGASRDLGITTPAALPAFNRAAQGNKFLDVFNTGTGAFAWTAQANVPWITLTRRSGTEDERVFVGVDWTKVPADETASGTVTISGTGSTRTVNVTARPAAVPNTPDTVGLVENNGLVVIEAEGGRQMSPRNGIRWEAVERAAVSGDGLTIFPTTAASVDPAAVATSAPWLEYRFYTFNAGPVTIRTACLPTHKPNAEHPGVRYAIALNDEPPQVVNVDADEYSAAWNVNVLRGRAYGVSRHQLAAPGVQRLRVYMVDAGVMLDRFDLRIGYKAGGEFEAEALERVASTGKTYRTFADPPASGGSAVAYEAKGEGDSFTVALPDLAAGAYGVAVRAKGLDNRGKVLMAVADTPEGPYTDFGQEMDLYSAGTTYPEFTGNRLAVTAPGTKYLRFRVTGHNPANTSGAAWIVVDRVTFTLEHGSAGR